ncbi:MAG: cupin domain-containing protein [Candidatus Dormibacteraeota bacterium]|nr:cupin domain-containing protein [Candidatus Dormibacteraeota bacterium]
MRAEAKALSGGEVVEFAKGKVELVTVGDRQIARGRYEPGWRWSEDVKPIVGTESCEHEHVGYVLTGRLHVRLNDGSEAEVGAGDAYRIPAGHDGWVVGDEAYEFIDVQMGNFGKASS